MKIALCQISNKLINPSLAYSKEQEYSDLLYKTREGYYRPQHFWEIPLWIAEVSNSIPNATLHIVEDVKESIKYLRDKKPEYVLFSCLEVNKHFIKTILEGCPEITFILGGYIDPTFFFKNHSNLFPLHVKWFENLPDAISFLGYKVIPGYSYRLFKKCKTIPRLVMSAGCLNRCAFCSAEKTIKKKSTKNVYAQIKSFRSLNFKLVYLNDKTFGQAKNYRLLPDIYRKIKKYNPNFLGFIIQTTATQFNRFSIEFAEDSHILYVEIGIESYNDDILKALNKPHRRKHIDETCHRIRNMGIKLIPNIIVGLTGQLGCFREWWQESSNTYQNTLTFLRNNRDIISHVNVYFLSLYRNTETSLQLNSSKEEDYNENNSDKSWLKGNHHKEFYAQTIQFGIGCLRGGKIYE